MAALVHLPASLADAGFLLVATHLIETRQPRHGCFAERAVRRSGDKDRTPLRNSDDVQGLQGLQGLQGFFSEAPAQERHGENGIVMKMIKDNMAGLLSALFAHDRGLGSRTRQRQLRQNPTRLLPRCTLRP